MATKKAVTKKGRTPMPAEMIYLPVPDKGETEDQKNARQAHNLKARALRLAAIGTKRVNKANNAIRLIGNLAAYKPTDTQIDKIIESLATSCQMLEARLRGTRRDTQAFTL